MRITASRSLVAVAVLVAFTLLAVLTGFAGTAQGAPQLTLATETPLTVTDGPVAVTVEGTVGGPWPDATLEMTLSGPAPPGAETRPSSPIVEGQEIKGLTGHFERTVVLEAEEMSEPGAYLLEAVVSAGPGKLMRSELWLGRIPLSPPSLEVAVVWPAIVGPHRDPDGVFVDGTVQRTVVPRADASGSIYSILTLPERFPGWHFTIAAEPLFLDQIRDLSDGYVERAEDGTVLEVGAEEEVPVLAEQALKTFGRVAGLEEVGILPGPFAMPSLSVLAAEGWADGTEQMRLGRQRVQSLLELPQVPDGGYSPGLEATTDGLRYMSEAAVDYTVVSEDVSRDLAVRPANPSYPVRATDGDNHRLTLLFADDDLRAAMGPPWDTGLFAAVLASKMAAGAEGPLLAAPAVDYEIPPESFIMGVGELLTQTEGVETLTVSEVVERYRPESRPVFLSRYGGSVEGFVSQGYLDALRNAHQSVEVFGDAADSEQAPLNTLKLLMFQGESRYWLRSDAGPATVNRGLSYLDAVLEIVRGEFDKIDVAGDKSVLLVGSGGEVPVAVVNRSGYSIDAVLEASGDGLEFREGAQKDVTLGVQENVIPFSVDAGRETTTMSVRVLVGDMLVDEGEVSITVLSVWTVVLWVTAAAGLALLVVVLLVRLRRRRVE